MNKPILAVAAAAILLLSGLYCLGLQSKNDFDNFGDLSAIPALSIMAIECKKDNQSAGCLGLPEHSYQEEQERNYETSRNYISAYGQTPSIKSNCIKYADAVYGLHQEVSATNEIVVGAGRVAGEVQGLADRGCMAEKYCALDFPLTRKTKDMLAALAECMNELSSLPEAKG